jgi:hypothetical protein
MHDTTAVKAGRSSLCDAHPGSRPAVVDEEALSELVGRLILKSYYRYANAWTHTLQNMILFSIITFMVRCNSTMLPKAHLHFYLPRATLVFTLKAGDNGNG